ncbi:type I restriction endonuclease subunit R [Capnocytophaga sp. ARDL2]|uniref:type I restriction endonuclease subunit R n=1 Tax=Capnocytophaga sp. ARDL2 TaxID=3238809 RepID=UPI0035579E8F
MFFTEDNTAQLPALKLLIDLGYQYLTPSEALSAREGRESNVLLTDILRTQLQKINTIKIGSKQADFTDANILRAIDKLKEIPLSDGFVHACNSIYNLLRFGCALEQSIDGDRKSHTLQYIDWNCIENNVFHVTEEFTVTRMGRKDSYRPDLVLFVNGIPLAVIESKSPTIKEPTREAISQHLRNQMENGIQPLYVYCQLLGSISLTEAKYATTNTKEEFWSVWKEKQPQYLQNLPTLVNQELSKTDESKVFFQSKLRRNSDFLQYKEKYQHTVGITAQDTMIYGLFSKERLLSLVKDFVVFEGGVLKKVARFQQFFAINKIIDRIQHIENGKRKGGVVWHTQGSGKSLTMAMLARKIKETIINPLIVVVTDREELDNQITATLKKVEIDVINASSGKHLVNLLKSDGDFVTTTIVNKFQAAVKKMGKKPLDHPNVFVLIDEAHRTQYGVFNTNMERILENACFIVFTGTPLMKKQKSTAQKFGGIIDTYTIVEAVEDKAIVPILYEGRLALQEINQKMIDRGFDRVSEGLSDYHKMELKRKSNNAQLISKTEQNITEIAWDISKHFSQTWGVNLQGVHSGFRGMVVCPDKLTAVKYKKAFDAIGLVKTEVVMSPPDTRENNEDVHSSTSSEVVQYYEMLKTKYGKDIENAIIQQYEKGESIELLIVIDKLLTGFDVPSTTVMYLCRKLREHTLLQAIARVNRVYPGKDYGFVIDYAGIMQELEEALATYSNEEDAIEKMDIQNTLTHIAAKVDKLPQLYADLLAHFNSVKNKNDLEEFVAYLSDIELRESFYEKFSQFAKVLKMALATVDFYKKVSEEKINRYKDDLKKFAQIRATVNNVYTDEISFAPYEKQLQNLLDQHVITEEIIRLTEQVDILDTKKFDEELSKIVGNRAKAEKIASATSKYISERKDIDPVWYQKLSELIQKTILEMRENRISDIEALKRLQEIRNEVTGVKTKDDMPESVSKKMRTKAVYRLLTNENIEESEQVTLFFEEILTQEEVVDWYKNNDVINRIDLQLSDYLMDVIGLSLNKAEELSKKCIEIVISNVKVQK